MDILAEKWELLSQGWIVSTWASTLLRWLHMIAAMAWIGSSFYFIHLDASLKANAALPEGTTGEAWQVHGGGFYHMVKYNVAPPELPPRLTWFKWESYTTWISGLLLLVVSYYLRAELTLIDHEGWALTPKVAVGLSLLGLAVAWLLYDRCCRLALAPPWPVLLCLLIVAAATWGWGQVFSGRGAFMQMGASLATIMTANVAFVIIPNQRRVVADLRAGKTPAAHLGRQAKQRSVHNNYLTLGVVLAMISNHLPLVTSGRWSWLIFVLLLAVGMVVRHDFNRRHRGQALSPALWGWAVLGVLGMILLALPGRL